MFCTSPATSTRTNNHTYIVFRLGLVGAYSTQTSQHAVIRMLMALPLLPAAHIVPAFRQLQCVTGIRRDNVARQLSVVAVNPLGLPAGSPNK